ncbi:MAG: hypothetical protein U0R76_17065 [Candidatus Nanopelagicales bacterium]
MGRRTPQEKKSLSYAKDRRNGYGENDKSSRKNVPLRKRLVNRANRHAAQQDLSDALGSTDAVRAEAVEQRMKGKRPKSWRKRPDIPLAEHMARREGKRTNDG